MTELRRKALGMQVENLADKRQVIVNCSAEEPDRVGDVVVQRGIDFTAFMKIGGTVLWQHDPDQPIAKAIEMKIVNGRLQSRVQFPDANVSSKANEIYGLIGCGIVNAASIGFSPKEWAPVDQHQPSGPQRYTAIELMEFSFVSVPCAPEATIIARSARAAATTRGKRSSDDDRMREFIENLDELTPEEQRECEAALERGDLVPDPRGKKWIRDVLLPDLEAGLAKMRIVRDNFARSSPKYREAKIRSLAVERKADEPWKWDPYASPAVNIWNMRNAEYSRFRR